MEKQCTKCGEVKPVSEFYKRASTKDGLQCYCKNCQRESQRQWEQENVEHLRAYREAYYAGGREVTPMKETPKYRAMHTRIRVTFGPATAYSCVRCGGAGQEWAYSNECPEEVRAVVSGKERRYCVHLDCYRPMCYKCHRAYDKVLQPTKR